MNKKMKKFITFEGMDGAGKSTHLANFAGALRARGHDVIVTREPGGTVLGEQLREILLQQKMSNDAEALLMFAARAEHLAQVIQPALAAGKVVISDRFSDATFAYQGSARGMDWAKLQALESWVQQGLQPDLTLFFDVTVAVSKQRLANNVSLDKFEQEHSDFFERVRAGYHRRVAEHPSRYVVLDATQTIEKIASQLSTILDTL
jgi:dTMP kinase